MRLKTLRCAECYLIFAVDPKLAEEESYVTCPKCDEQVDVEDDALELDRPP